MATLAYQETVSGEESVVIDALDSAMSREKGGGYIFSWPIKSLANNEGKKVDALGTLFKHYKFSRV